MKITRLDYTKSKINRDYIDEQLFEEAINIQYGKAKGLDGIGTLAEKSVHSILKYYYAPNESFHEMKIDDAKGKYVADACIDGEIYEIQSKSFYTMKGKLDSFLVNHDVTIIYPVAFTKYLKYIDKETGEISESKKSSDRGTIFDIVQELYGISDYLCNKRLHFIICFIEMEEYKLITPGKLKVGKNGRIVGRRNAEKTDRVPTKILGEFRINNKKDFLNFLPGFENGKKQKDCPLPVDFTTKDIATLTGFHISYAQMLVNVLTKAGAIKRTGKEGRLYTYRIK